MLTLLGLVIGFMGLFGFIACIGGLIYALVTQKGKFGWIIGLVLTIFLLGGGIFVVALERPDIQIPVLTAILHKDSGNKTDSGGLEADRGLFSVKITVPAEFVEEGMTQEKLDEQIKESKVKSATLNADGSVSYVMSKDQHKELMKGIREGIDNSLSEMAGSEDFPNVVSVEANGDYTKYTVTVSTEELGLEESISMLGFYLFSGTYHAFNGTEIDNVCVQFINEASGDVIEEFNSNDVASNDSSGGEDSTQNTTGSTETTAGSAPESDSSTSSTISDPVIYSGSGDDVVMLEPFDGVFVFHIIGNAGERHFSVKGFDANGESTRLFVNTTAQYDGITIDPLQETVMLEVNATGDWTVEVRSINAMETIAAGETLSGSGDSVILVSSYGNTATISGNAEEHHFSVKSYGTERDKLLVNTTDAYEGTVMLTGKPIILEVDAEGAWSITFE